MKKIFLFPMIALLTNCFFKTKTIVFEELLINVYGKIMNRQHIEFLEKEGSKYKITTYSFHIDLKKDKKNFGCVPPLFYELNSEYVDVRHYQTSADFRKRVNKWNIKYYEAIDSGFVNMDNRTKMNILNRLTSGACSSNEN